MWTVSCTAQSVITRSTDIQTVGVAEFVHPRTIQITIRRWSTPTLIALLCAHAYYACARNVTLQVEGWVCSCVSKRRMEKRVGSLFAATLILVCSGFSRVECLNCTDVLSGCQCKGPGVNIDISEAFDYP